jgi:UDP-N-acetyl-2-amino-2-deoxyglucuronate dehydrogenase
MADGITVAFITHGGGAHVGAYLSALQHTEQCRRVVLCDPDARWDAEATQKLGERLATIYRDVPSLLATERPEMALVSMEAAIAPPVIEAAINSGCHVFAEKPSCVRVEQFESLVQKADSKHIYLMLALANRLNPEIVAARRLIETGQIGTLYGIEMHLIADQTRLTRESYHSQWFAQKARSGGGHLIWLGIHWLDLGMFLCQSSIRSVTGAISNVGGQPIDVEDSAVATLEFDNGMLGTMTSGYYLDRGYHSHIKIWGSQGWLHLEPMLDKPLHWSTTKGEQAGRVQEWSGDKNPRGYTPIVQAAVKACVEASVPPVSSVDSLNAIKTVFGIYQSAADGRRVQL